MKYQRSKIKYFAFWIVVLLFAFCFLPSSFAQEQIPLVISPARQLLEVLPSEQRTFEITIFNKGSRSISGTLGASDFIVKNDGVPVLVDQNPYPQLSAASWINLPNEIAIEPNSSQAVNISLLVPSNAPAGGRYVGIFFEPRSTSLEDASNISVRIVSLLSVKVLGEIKENAQLALFQTPSFLESQPVPVNFAITNMGDYHIVPSGKIQLVDIFGNVVESADVEPKNIFPKSTLKYEVKLGKKFLIGPYKVRLKVLYGSSGKVLQKERVLFVFPLKLFLIVLLGFIILYYMIRSVRGNSRTSIETRSDDKLSSLRESLKKRND